MSSRVITVCCGFVVLMSAACGCGHTNHAPANIKIVEGSLSVKNLSDRPIFPVVQMKRREDFGGVSAGAVAMIGFATVDADGIARVDWSEEDWDAPKRTVSFSLKITPDIAAATKHLEFRYGGSNTWALLLYSNSPPAETNLLITIDGVVREM